MSSPALPKDRLVRFGPAAIYATLGIFVFLAVAYKIGGFPSSFQSAAQTPAPPAVRTQPVSLTIFPFEMPPIEEHDLKAIARMVPPHFGNYKAPVMMVYHALRVWGEDAPFGGEAVRLEEKGLTGRGLFLNILTRTEDYRKYTRFTLDRMLAPSPYGVQVICTSDAGWGQEWGSTHIGKYLQVMGELGCPSTTPLVLDGGQQAVLADVVRDEALRLHLDVELEWVTIGLGLYLDTDHWQNRFGQTISFDDLAQRLIERPFGKGACLGTHVPFALASLVNIQQTQPILSPAKEAAVRGRLQEYAAQLSRVQRADGSWSKEWAADQSAADPSAQPGREVKDVANALLATGHHVEWMAFCPPDLRPSPAVLDKAAHYLVRNIPRYRELMAMDFHAYLPATHAVRAVLTAGGRRWADPAWLSAR